MAPRRKKLPQTVNTVQRPRAYYQYRYGTVQRALKSAWERAGKKPKWAVFVASSVAGHIRTTTETRVRSSMEFGHFGTRILS